MDLSKKNLLITGNPGVGKTTLVEKVAVALAPFALGFTTGEIRTGGQRVGFSIKSLDGAEGILAHADRRGSPRVGKYGVNLPDLEAVGVEALTHALQHARLIIIDEIGKMELFSPLFRRVVVECLDSPKPVLATVPSRGHPFVDEIKLRPDVEIVSLTRANRDRLAADIIAALKRRISPRVPGG